MSTIRVTVEVPELSEGALRWLRKTAEQGSCAVPPNTPKWAIDGAFELVRHGLVEGRVFASGRYSTSMHPLGRAVLEHYEGGR